MRGSTKLKFTAPGFETPNFSFLFLFADWHSTFTDETKKLLADIGFVSSELLIPKTEE